MKRTKGALALRLLGLLLAALLAVFTVHPGKTATIEAAAKVVYIGINLPFAGDEAEEAKLDENGMLLAIEEANAKGGPGGYKIDTVILSDSTPTAGGYDPAQSAANARKLVANPGVVAILGPQDSGAAKAMLPILSEGDLATVSAATTNPDMTAPKFAAVYRPKGKVVYFRTVDNDTVVGPGMANFVAEKLNVRSVFVLDDGGAYGVGLADTFTEGAKKKGMKVLGRDRLNPLEADYTTILTKIKGLNTEAIFYCGNPGPAVKLAKQAYDSIPNVIKTACGSIIESDFLTAGFPAIAGWYGSEAAPHFLEDPELQGWVSRYVKRWGKQPGDLALTSYEAALVIIDAIRRVAKSGMPVNRHTVRDAIQATNLKSFKRVISFDANGDLLHPIVSVFKVVHNAKYPEGDVRQFKYIGIVPEN